MINLCIPTIKRYDLLRGALRTAVQANPGPDQIYLIDNGQRPDKIHEAIMGVDCPFIIHQPEVPMGIAESWNWFIKHASEHRIISNDDVTFAPHSFQSMIDTEGDIVYACGASCYLLRDRCVEIVGLFDETISPGYAYFEDCDYAFRIKRFVEAGVPLVMANAPDNGVHHFGSQTWQSGTQKEIDEHWKKFAIAKANFLGKWGRLPE